MGYLTIFVILLVTALFAVRLKEDFYDMLPVVVSALILILYALAFGKGLAWVDAAAAFLLVGILTRVCVKRVRFLKRKKEKGNIAQEQDMLWNRFTGALRMLVSWRVLLFLGICVCMTLLLEDKIALWWDDINYWAVDAKALYYNGGFAGKYGNVAPEFGDYPPALQLFKWLFLHLQPDAFCEGLMFGAYHCLNLIYLLPLLKKIPDRKPWYLILGLVGIFLVPGIVDGIAREGTCADVTMGIIYGALLWAVVDKKDHGDAFYYGRLMLHASVLVLTKSVGIEWAFFGMVFFALFAGEVSGQKGRTKEKENALHGKALWKRVVLTALPCLLVEGSWLLFCLLNRRVAKLTGAGVKIALSGDLSFFKNAYDKMVIYAKGFFLYPMHGEQTYGIDLSAAALLFLILLVIAVYKRFDFLSRKEAKKMLGFVLVTAFMAYGIIFLGHITIFAQELQYEDPYVMAKSIARYGAPFTLGLLYLFMGILIEKKGVKGYVFCLFFVLLTTSLPGAYQTLWGYRDTGKEDRAGREEMAKEAETFIEKAAALKAEDDDLFLTRTLYLRDDDTIHWVKDTYISFYVSPVPVVYGGVSADMDEDAVKTAIQNSHAGYLYVDNVSGGVEKLFAQMTQGTFACETFYEIKEENGNILLVPVS